MLVRTAADELGHWDIRVNSIQPGLVPTELSASLEPIQKSAPNTWTTCHFADSAPPQHASYQVRPAESPEYSSLSTAAITYAAAQRFESYVRREHGANG